MSFAQYVRNDFNDWAETIGPFQGNNIPEAQNTNPNPTHSLSSTNLPATDLPDRQRTRLAAQIEPQRSDTMRDPESKDTIPKGVTNSQGSDLTRNYDTHLKAQNDGLQQRSPSMRMKKIFPEFNTYHLNLNLCSQIHTLQQDVVGLLRWQDCASMTIKELEEDAETRKSETRVMKKTTAQAEAEMQHQISEYKHQIEQVEQNRIRVSNENTHAVKAHERNLQDAKQEIETQKKAREEAAAAAARRSTEAETKHTEELKVANRKIEELRGGQTYKSNSQREIDDLHKRLSQAEKQKAGELSAKDLKIAALQTTINDRDLEIRRLGTEAESAKEARRELIRQKNDLAHAMVGLERRAESLETQNRDLVVEREQATSRAVDAEGRAKGSQDQLKASRTKTEHWERLYQEAMEDARDRVLSVYEIPAAHVPMEDPETAIMTTNEKQRLSALIEELRFENSRLREEPDRLNDNLESQSRDWEAWAEEFEKHMVRWCEAEKEEAIKTERANSQVTSGTDAREQAIRRECEAEKQQALTMERENGRAQLEARESLLWRQFGRKLSSNTDLEMRRLRGGNAVGHKKQIKIKNGQMKWVFNEAVSRAVQVERSLLLGQFQEQFQVEISNHKTQFNSRHASTQTQTGTHDTTMDLILLNEEIRKRDLSINSHKQNLTDALVAQRDLEAALTLSKAENEHLSLAVNAYESQTSLAKQTQTEAQVSLMVRDLSRALKLFAEISTVGLDEKHRIILNELVIANKVVTDIRTTIEDGSVIVDYDSFQGGLDRIMASSDPYDALDPRERPALHAQLSQTYAVIGGLSNILAGERGDSTKWEILERIYIDNIKGKGKQVAVSGSGVASGSSSGGNSGSGAASSSQVPEDNSSTGTPKSSIQTAFTNTSTPNTTPNPSTNSSSTEPTTNAGESQDEPEWIDSATAHANLDPAHLDPDYFRWDDFRVEDIDFDTPEWRAYEKSSASSAIS